MDWKLESFMMAMGGGGLNGILDHVLIKGRQISEASRRHHTSSITPTRRSAEEKPPSAVLWGDMCVWRDSLSVCKHRDVYLYVWATVTGTTEENQ